MKTKKSLGFGWVAFWLILFWPVGLVLLFKKLNDKTALMSTTKTPTTVAWILIGFSALMLFSNIEQISSDFHVALIIFAWLIGGILILLKVRATKIKAAQYKKYLNAIVNVGERNIDNIANAVSATYEDAKINIQAMIDNGFLKGAYIHEGNRVVVLSQDIQAKQATETVEPPKSDQPQLRPVKCPGCGANNIVTTGIITECDYCGTPMTG